MRCASNGYRVRETCPSPALVGRADCSFTNLLPFLTRRLRCASPRLLIPFPSLCLAHTLVPSLLLAFISIISALIFQIF